jgi:hypothetical protein
MDPQTALTLGQLLSQSSEIFNTYGKDSEAFRSLFKAFKQDLAEYSEESIVRAFNEWRKTKSVMPTPADILKLLGYGPKPVRGPDSVPVKWLPGEREDWIKNQTKKAPWAGRMWPEIPQMHDAIRQHIRNLAVQKSKDHAADYCKFLANHAGAPKSLAHECNV